MHRFTLIIYMLFAISTQAFAQGKVTTDSLDRYINHAIENQFFPGAQVVIGDSNGIKFSKSYGYMDYSNSKLVTDSTLYDVASCTKVCATTLAVMTLIDDGRLTAQTRIDEIIELPDTIKFGDIRIEELLYHTAGFRPFVSVAFSLSKSAHEGVHLLSRKQSEANPYPFDDRYFAAKDILYDPKYVSHCSGENRIKIAKDLYVDKEYHKILDSLVYAAHNSEQRGRHIYSDLSFYMLQKVVEKVSRTTLDSYTQHIYDQMNLQNIGYKPLSWSHAENICPTEYDALFRRDTMRGLVHDELACVLGGVGGNAGLFSSANNIAQICAMFLRGGVDYNGEQIVKGQTVDAFTKFERGVKKSIYALGFTKVDNKDLPYTPQSYGHTGYTGAYMWIDPDKDIYVVMLSNRVHPTRGNKKFNGEYRGKLWEIATAIDFEK